MVEIPAGGIDAYENVYDTVRREVKEECGLEVTKFVEDFQSPVVQPFEGDKAFVFKPFICQQMLAARSGLPWIGFVFICEVQGEVKMDGVEAIEPRWITIPELKDLVVNNSNKIFPLQLPVLQYYLQYLENN